MSPIFQFNICNITAVLHLHVKNDIVYDIVYTYFYNINKNIGGEQESQWWVIWLPYKYVKLKVVWSSLLNIWQIWIEWFVCYCIHSEKHASKWMAGILHFHASPLKELTIIPYLNGWMQHNDCVIMQIIVFTHAQPYELPGMAISDLCEYSKDFMFRESNHPEWCCTLELINVWMVV